MTMISRKEKKKNKCLDFTFFLDVLMLESWVGIFGFIASGVFVLWLFEKNSRGNAEGLFGSALALVGVAMIQRDCETTLRSKSSKSAFLVISIGAFLIFSVYTATLTSIMVAKPNSASFKNFEEFLTTGSSITVLGNSANYDLFKVRTLQHNSIILLFCLQCLSYKYFSIL